MKLRSLCAILVAVVALTFTAPRVCAQDGLEGALSQANLASPANLGTPFSQTIAAADFDGDNKPDGAVLVDYGWLRPQNSFRTIELHFTSRGNTYLTFESNETALAILALDVNRDGATDIVVEQPFTHKRLQVWLNDGHGGFRKVRSEDFPSDGGQRLESLSWRPEAVLCPPPRRGSETAVVTAWPLLYHFSPACEQALPFGSLIGSSAVAPNSSRAPPLLASL